jgi:hypothetical protein
MCVIPHFGICASMMLMHLREYRTTFVLDLINTPFSLTAATAAEYWPGCSIKSSSSVSAWRKTAALT